jgi:hypothetical protein
MAEEVESFVTPPANETMRLHGALGEKARQRLLWQVDL